jgi:hypothetical protein
MADKTSESPAAGGPEKDVTRRNVIKIAVGAAIAVPLVSLKVAARAAGAPVPQGKAPLFFTKEEFALVDELTELIIPADDHSPGARAAEVTAYIDARLAESFEEEPKQTWRAGLKTIEALSEQMHGRRFLEATPEQRVALLTRISQNESKAEKPEEKFFGELKGRTVYAYYTSKIGIHDEMEYKGNTYLKEFVGYEAK